MKKSLYAVLLLVSFLLSGCGSRNIKSRFEAFSDALAAGETLAFTASIRAEYPDRSAAFTLRYEKDAAGETVTVRKPELIAGLTARVAPDGGALLYDGMILDAGPLDDYGLTPVSALPKLAEALRTGYVDSVWEEGGLSAVKLIPDDHLSVTVWFDEGMIPVRAELASDGTVSVFCELSDWS